MAKERGMENGGDEPSARWWSSKALKPAKAAPPARSSWLNFASLGLPLV
jgi:hypothetical protein